MPGTAEPSGAQAADVERQAAHYARSFLIDRRAAAAAAGLDAEVLAGYDAEISKLDAKLGDAKTAGWVGRYTARRMRAVDDATRRPILARRLERSGRDLVRTLVGQVQRARGARRAHAPPGRDAPASTGSPDRPRPSDDDDPDLAPPAEATA